MGIANLINIFEPEYVVVCGGLVVAADLFIGPAEREARARALPALARRVEIRAAGAGARAGLIGAGLLARQMMEQPEPGVPKRDTPNLIANRGAQ